MAVILPEAPWRRRHGLRRILTALDAEAGSSRFVGGAVRDSLLGLAVKDVDVATILTPDLVERRLTAAGIKSVPTGIAHGTITAVCEGCVVEVTTLRSDVSTDGRRATVAFSTDWRADASRRDFTINALYAHAGSGVIDDFFGGLDDLEQRRVRFIGEPLQRIAEDHLRILRFFRFHARFGAGPADPAAVDACTRRANDLMALSRERIADELLKLLSLPDPRPTVAMMLERGIFAPVLPEIDAAGLERLRRLVDAELAAGVAADGERRLAALLPPDPALAERIAARLKLSNRARKRLAIAADQDLATTPQALAHAVGTEGALDRLLIAGRPADAASIADWPVPRLGIGGGQLIARGLAPGPAVARTLQAIERRWVAEGFPDGERLDQIVAEELASANG